MTQVEQFAQLSVVQFANAHRDVKKSPRPVEPVWPWPGKDDVTAEEREELLAQLEARSAMRDR